MSDEVKTGRPLAEVDAGKGAELVEKLAGLACTTAEIATLTGVSTDTLERRFAANINKGRNAAKASLRRRQWEVAMSGNVAMLIWLGKNILGQKDRTEIGVRRIGSIRDLGDDELRALANEQGIELPAEFGVQIGSMSGGMIDDQ